MPTYDVHAHCIPSTFRDWLAANGSRVGVDLIETPKGPAARLADKVTTAPFRDDITDFDLRMEKIDGMGIDVQVLAGWIDLTGYELPRAVASEYTRAHNTALAEEAARAPERFRTIGTAPLQHPDLAAEELGHAMNELGMAGVEIATTVDGAFLDQVEGLDAFWEAAEELGAFVLLHPMRPLTGVDVSRFFMDNMVARPAESTISLAGLIFSGVFERYPDLKLCIVHGGGFAPFQVGRMDKGYEKVPGKSAQHITKPPSDYLKALYFDTVVHDHAALDYLIRYFGHEKIVAGTDYPFPMGDQDPMGFVRSLPGISDEAVEAITGGNAERLLR
ncbi:MAG: amidohydrolase [Acidimicrobiia bacterium]|jgi:aminocarboxymuconate-semialdehyde decarboxylase|nr:MAG: amidohydrolase [Acidimicrobiia bacterium]